MAGGFGFGRWIVMVLAWLAVRFDCWRGGTRAYAAGTRACSGAIRACSGGTRACSGGTASETIHVWKMPRERNYEFDIFIFRKGAISKCPASEIWLLTFFNLAGAVITLSCEKKKQRNIKD